MKNVMIIGKYNYMNISSKDYSTISEIQLLEMVIK